MEGLFLVAAYIQVCGGCQDNSCGYGILATKGELWCLLYILCSQYWYSIVGWHSALVRELAHAVVLAVSPSISCMCSWYWYSIVGWHSALVWELAQQCWHEHWQWSETMTALHCLCLINTAPLGTYKCMYYRWVVCTCVVCLMRPVVGETGYWMSKLTVWVLQFYVYTTVPTHLSDVRVWSQLFLVCSITVDT